MTPLKIVLFSLILLITSALVVYFFFLRASSDLEQMSAELEDLVQTDSISENMKILAARPHRAGTAENHTVAERITSELRNAGANVWTSEYSVSLPQPGKGTLTLTAPLEQVIDFSEKQLENDEYSKIATVEPPFFAYVPDSDIEAEVIYANFGDREDYQTLKDHGVSVAGKIALVRSQRSCRGMKQMIAEEQGLAGLLLYPEPKDQGFKKQPYPAGPGIHPDVAQRGTMLKFFVYPGDPGMQTLDNRENNLPTVPALPITPTAAQLILKHLDGPVISKWAGWMKTDYASGPGSARVRMTYASTQQQGTIKNIFATLGGSNPSDPALMISTHYDAWVYGASDPDSGVAVVLETAKALFALEKNGWKPKRDIVFAFWDAEEYGMIGSTRWVLNHLEEVRSKISNVLYIDSVRGPMFIAGILPGMRGLLDEVLGHSTDPNTGKSVLDFHMEYGMPGYSDDMIPFSNLVGVPVAQLNYGQHFPMYHSLYDNLTWVEKFGDPGYAYATNLARIVSLYAIALTSEERLPFRYSEFAAYYRKELERMKLEEAESQNKTQFEEAIASVRELGALAARIEHFDFNETSVENRRQINSLLQQAIVSFTEPPGQASRPFRMRNVILGPLPHNECGGTGLPTIRRALLEKRHGRLDSELRRLTNHFSNAAQTLRKAVALIDSKNAR